MLQKSQFKINEKVVCRFSKLPVGGIKLFTQSLSPSMVTADNTVTLTVISKPYTSNGIKKYLLGINQTLRRKHGPFNYARYVGYSDLDYKFTPTSFLNKYCIEVPARAILAKSSIKKIAKKKVCKICLKNRQEA